MIMTGNEGEGGMCGRKPVGSYLLLIEITVVFDCRWRD